MKKAINYTLAHVFYWAGDICSNLCFHKYEWGAWFWRPYQWCMSVSERFDTGNWVWGEEVEIDFCLYCDEVHPRVNGVCINGECPSNNK